MKKTRTAFGLMIASGFAGLGYQIVWTQQCALWLGHEAAAVLAVLTAFFGGLALGALTLGRRIERSPRPERWYAACELSIALWSLALALLMAPVSAGLLEFTGAQPSLFWQWAVAFCGSLLLLLPATAAMGATLPAMARVVAQITHAGQPRNRVAALYACNTLGAVIGVLASAFWLVPEFGLARSAGLCAALNLFCAAAALTLTAAARDNTMGRPAALPVQAPAIQPAQKRALATLAATGLLGIGYEVLVVRVISQVTENTVYTFAILLAVYLVGTALGAAAYQRWLNQQMPGLISGRGDLQRAPLDAAALRDRLLCLLAAACLLGNLSLWGAEHTRQFMALQLGVGMGSALAAEAALALAAFALPTLVMGALFSHLSTSASIDTENKGRTAERISFSLALSFNTLGAAAAPLLFGVLVVPLLGAKVALLSIAAGYLALVSRKAWATWSQPGAWGVTLAGLALAVWTPPLIFVDVPEGGHVVSYREGAMAAVSVVEDANGVARLRIDNRQQEGSSASLWADARQALLPLLLHPAPKHVLFLGLGTGVTASAAAANPRLRVEAVELLPEVIAASAYFTAPPANELNAGAMDNSRPRPQLHLLAADARRFVKATEQHYDVIVSDNFHPARSGSGSLYTVEHFQAVQARLTGSGLFCQWLPLHQLDLETLRSIVQSFVAVYPGAWAMLATNSLETPVLGLVGRADNSPAGHFDLDLDQLRLRLADKAWPQALADFGITDEFALLGSFIAGPQALKRFAGSAPRNTDDHPVVAYRAPRITYAPDSLPRDRLLALLQWLHADSADSADPTQLIDANLPPAWGQRLAAYWTARDQFIEAGRNVRAAADVKAMLAQVRQPLLSVLHTSPDFRPAYDPLLRMAAALTPSDKPAARALLTELVQAQPLRPEAAQALQQLSQQTR